MIAGETSDGGERVERRKRSKKYARGAAVLIATLVLAAPMPVLAQGAENATQARALARVTAEVSPDEQQVVLAAKGASASSATSLVFDVWAEEAGEEAAVRRGAKQLDDGSWTSTVFISPETPSEPGVPRYCKVAGAVHRLYNPFTGQHLYTSEVGEAESIIQSGWSYEGVAWIEPEDERAAEPVYRLYNPTSGDHFYTMDSGEYDALSEVGWRPEGVGFRSDPDSAQPVYRLFNPYAEIGTHHYTTSETEREDLVSLGWQEEGTSWFGAGVNADGTWSLPSGNRPLSAPGAYHVEALAILDDGTETPLGEATFSVSAPSASASIVNVNEEDASFDVVVGDVHSATGVAEVLVPVWGADDQRDIVWYPAEPQEDGTYLAHVRAADHAYARAYTAHAYVRAGNGLLVNVAQATCALELQNLVYLAGGPKTYTLSIVNPGPASSVTMPTWSEDGGQDDLVWYEATQEGDRWTATIDATNFLHSGRCITHVYVDGELREPFSFTVSPKEVLTRRQRAIINAALNTPSIGYGYCAGWVSIVLMNAGQPYNLSDDANDMYYRLSKTNLDELLPGMCIAVSTHSHTPAGRRWGHVGIYLGDGVVVDEFGYIRRSDLDWWVSYYGDLVPVRFGFLEY